MFEFIRAGGPFMILLLLTSIVGVAFIVERGLALRWTRVLPVEVEDAVEKCKSPADLGALKQICVLKPSPLSRLLLVAADHFDWPKEENAGAVQTRARHEVVQLERGLVVLEVVVGIAPLLGLVGTIVGMMTVFGEIGRAHV